MKLWCNAQNQKGTSALKKHTFSKNKHQGQVPVSSWMEGKALVLVGGLQLLTLSSSPVGLGPSLRWAKKQLGAAAYIVGRKFSEQLRTGICAVSKMSSYRMSCRMFGVIHCLLITAQLLKHCWHAKTR